MPPTPLTEALAPLTEAPAPLTETLAPLAEATVDWSEVHAVRLLGVALAVLFLLWAIRRMFGGK
ncbi:hypothetical protein [Actinoplanes sp. NPDC051851]|uniref:hypothetical protein n=1 Tax=Actinoplanes sp. NPDC051851 TaxID=3154753 RepID=UPI003428EFC9